MNNIHSFSDYPNGIVEDSFQAFLVEGATFTKNEEYPILRRDMIPSEIPERIMPFSKAITFRGDLSKTYICTYSPDRSFERVRRNPRKYISFFKRTAGIIGFDYSIHTDMPIIKQKQQINDNLSLSYFFGNQGIPLIPNIRCGIDELLPEFLTAIPKQSMVAIGTHGFIKETSEKCEWFCFLERLISIIEPKTIVVYGNLRGKMFEEMKNKTKFEFYEPWITQRRKEADEYVYKRCK